MSVSGFVWTSAMLALAPVAAAAPQSGPGFELLYALSTEGSGPIAGVIEGSDGFLYGTTVAGGAHHWGTIFKLNKDGSNPVDLFDFDANSTGINPNGLLEASDHALYGTTRNAGANYYGTIFTIHRDGSGFTVLHDFNTPDGAYSVSRLIEGTDGLLYGTTQLGGANSSGVAFRIKKDGTGYEAIWNFGIHNEGGQPYGMTLASDGSFYGVCYTGGLSTGTIFKLSSQVVAGQLVWSCSALKNFDILFDGGYPAVNLIQGSDGALYGMTSQGGSIGGPVIGTLYKINTDGSGFTILKKLDAASGDYPVDGSALAEGADGMIYATTPVDGALGGGTVLRCKKDGTEFGVVVDFDPSGAAGDLPAGLVRASDGNLYGTTHGGSVAVNGAVYRLVLTDASWENYGGGLAGTLGVPSFTSSADPVLGSTITLTIGNSRGIQTGAILLAGLSRANIPVKGGKILVGSLLLTVPIAIPAPSLSLPSTLPNDPAYAGIVLDLQAIEADPGAVKGLSFTPGLELVLGY